MIIDGLTIPQRILDLVEAGKWPRTVSEANKQNLKSLVSSQRIKQFAPEEDQIFLYPPSSFRTVAREVSVGNAGFWSKFGALHEISPQRALIIGDFGLGSDTAIVLDYRESNGQPSVLRLKWGNYDGQAFDGSRNHWVQCAKSVEEFIDILDLDSMNM
jgi:hypothetical protein